MAGLKVDPYSETWRAVSAHVEETIEHARTKLETRNLSASETEWHRGRIAGLRELLKLRDSKDAEPEVLVKASYVD